MKSPRFFLFFSLFLVQFLVQAPVGCEARHVRGFNKHMVPIGFFNSTEIPNWIKELVREAMRDVSPSCHCQSPPPKSSSGKGHEKPHPSPTPKPKPKPASSHLSPALSLALTSSQPLSASKIGTEGIGIGIGMGGGMALGMGTVGSSQYIYVYWPSSDPPIEYEDMMIGAPDWFKNTVEQWYESQVYPGNNLPVASDGVGGIYYNTAWYVYHDVTSNQPLLGFYPPGAPDWLNDQLNYFYQTHDHAFNTHMVPIGFFNSTEIPDWIKELVREAMRDGSPSCHCQSPPPKSSPGKGHEKPHPSPKPTPKPKPKPASPHLSPTLSPALTPSQPLSASKIGTEGIGMGGGMALGMGTVGSSQYIYVYWPNSDLPMVYEDMMIGAPDMFKNAVEKWYESQVYPGNNLPVASDGVGGIYYDTAWYVYHDVSSNQPLLGFYPPGAPDWLNDQLNYYYQTHDY